MVVVTQVFANLAITAAQARGFKELRMLVLPHPMETRSAQEIRNIAVASMDQLREQLLAPSPSIGRIPI